MSDERFEHMSSDEKRQYILDCVTDAVSDLMYYDRKQSTIAKPGDFERALREGALTVEDMVETFRKAVAQSI